MTLCPVCESADVVETEKLLHCLACGNKWERPPQPIIVEFPYPLHTFLYSPNRFQGVIKDVTKHEVIGYEVTDHGIYINLLPKSYDGIAVMWRLDSDNLYETEEEAKGDKA